MFFQREPRVRRPFLGLGVLGITLSLFVGCATQAEQKPMDKCCKTENIVLVTIDGVRWQDIFKGIDKELLKREEFLWYSRLLPKLHKQLNASTPLAAREKLMPFFWGTVAQQGVVLGDRTQGSECKLTNAYHFSYPGYNELLTGVPDKTINSNRPVPNPNKSILEQANELPAFAGKVAAFGSWDNFPYILNADVLD
jgi:hypothetical protein